MDAALQRLLDADDLGDLGSLSTVEIRQRRAAAEEQETAISYARRVLQGRLDILRAELERRESQGDGQAADLLAALPGILAGDHRPTDPLHARATRLSLPDTAHVLEQQMDEIADEAALADLRERDTADLQRLMDRLADKERELSGVRRKLFDRIDALRDELAARYKDGRADVRELLSDSPSGDG